MGTEMSPKGLPRVPMIPGCPKRSLNNACPSLTARSLRCRRCRRCRRRQGEPEGQSPPTVQPAGPAAGPGGEQRRSLRLCACQVPRSPATEMPSPLRLLALWLCSALCASPCAGGVPQLGPGRAACPVPCHCQEDGIMLSADCSELGLSTVPVDLDPLTAYLDLSMNNLTELQPGLFRHLRFLEELRLSGNHLSHIPGQAFSGLYSLKILMLQNNELGGIPAEALWELPGLQSL
uniref:leucine-rich repeat-containing G-protein coupled receptor 6-like n=1 Tax=Urocitellus parryii TaxID=9999 RepID=UPI000E55A130|nr:leucine-rich repeat-containing G-protein coupled receptor 6-like [Urocitellus parryii]